MGMIQPHPSAGWTGAQYSLTRVLLGVFLAVQFAGGALGEGGRVLASVDEGPAGIATRWFPNVFALAQDTSLSRSLLALAALASLAIAAGWKRRAAALVLGYLATAVYLRDPSSLARCLPALILLHAAAPTAPFGSLAAKGRTDPGGGWRMPPDLFIVGWVVLASNYAFDGVTRLLQPSGEAWRQGTAIASTLASPAGRLGISDALLLLPAGLLKGLTWTLLGLQLAFLPLAFNARTRAVLWSSLFAVQIAALLSTKSADTAMPMIFLHLFTFEPRWLRAKTSGSPETIFYDGNCGLCHGWVRFVLAEDRRETFRFATLESETLATALPAQERSELPDSVVALGSDGRPLVRSAAAIHMLKKLGGLWLACAFLAERLPSSFRDDVYDTIARYRHRFFRRPEDTCPIVPPALGARFLP